jgi:hypothetical protein
MNSASVREVGSLEQPQKLFKGETFRTQILKLSSKYYVFSAVLSNRQSFFFKYFFGGFFLFFPYNIQLYFICRPSDSTVPTNAGIEPRTVATGALAARRSNH